MGPRETHTGRVAALKLIDRYFVTAGTSSLTVPGSGPVGCVTSTIVNRRVRSWRPAFAILTVMAILLNTPKWVAKPLG